MKKSNQNSKGFSYIDVMIAMVIMLVGVLALTSALTANLMRSYDTDKRIIAKQMALSTIESIIAVRDIERPGTIDGWDSIGNVDNNVVNGVAKGIFMKDWNPIREENGWDGVAGTIDDACSPASSCDVPGRPSNTSDVIEGYSRKIEITDVQDLERPTPPNPFTRRRIDVTIKYFTNGYSRDEKVSTLVANY